MMPPFSSDQPHTILIAASAAYDVRALARMLVHHHFDVVQVHRGDEALKAVRSGNVALALLDVALAGSASLELCPRLRQAGERPLPVFLLSAHPGEEERLRAEEAGAAAYLPLSFTPEDLAEKILLQLQVITPAPLLAGVPTMATLEVNYHTMLAGSPDAILLMQRGSNHILDVNHRTRQLFGITETELVQSDLLALCPPVQPDGQPSAQVFSSHVEQVMAGQAQLFEMTMQHSSGRAIACELRLVPLTTAEHRLMHVRVADITARKLATALRDGKNALLEMIASGAPLSDTLDKLVRLIEAQLDGGHCSVMLLNHDGLTVHNTIGPSLPQDYLQALIGLPIGPAAGSCGTAMFRKDTVIVSDILNDPLWAAYRNAAAHYGLRACWSMPILLDKDTVLGSFAMYYTDVREPTAEDRELIRTASHLAGIAIVRTRREEELQRHREHLEELVAARTVELLHAKEEAEHINEELTTALDNLSMTQEELVRRDKLAALGALVAGVAHELNTPIGNSLMMADSMAERTAALRRDLQGGLRRSVLESYLEQAASADEVMLRNLNRAAALIDSFKRIAVDGGSSPRGRFKLGDVVAELLQSVQPQLRQLDLELIEDVEHWLEMDSYPGPLAQVLSNLINNSLVHGFAQRNHQPGSITLSVHDSGNGEIAIHVSDTGAGIALENLPRIYDPFFTTRMGASSGLGLYITHNIVTGVLGGRIEAASTPGHGTSFMLRLPKVAPL
ncbi:GAF domain-containing protein [Duganella sp. FT80W]|uniref:histidine kinase n=1 Tax=Duganella guangzhouensis TaxID=2666084 RepID=A0A6I2KVR2_9BURK|nr:ATP-binding protein [Duganella guangzhouensis]MRW88464.1 GAF domain-containing protein [Duganella guangzhouensis]